VDLPYLIDGQWALITGQSPRFIYSFWLNNPIEINGISSNSQWYGYQERFGLEAQTESLSRSLSSEPVNTYFIWRRTKKRLFDSYELERLLNGTCDRHNLCERFTRTEKDLLGRVIKHILDFCATNSVLKISLYIVLLYIHIFLWLDKTLLTTSSRNSNIMKFYIQRLDS